MNIYRTFWACCCFVGVGYGNAAPPLEAYGNLPVVSQMVVSPNGERIAYRNTESDEKDYIVVYSLKEQKFVELLAVDQIDPQFIEFAGNDHLVLVVTKHVDSRQYAHNFDAGTAYAFDIGRNKVRRLVTLAEWMGLDQDLCFSRLK